MPLITSKANGGSFGYGWSSPALGAPEELGGMVLLAPTSVDYSGTSASIGTNGSVEFTTVTSLSLNGVFSATYDNYMVVCRGKSSTLIPYTNLRLRASGVDNATGGSYVRQELYVNDTNISGARATSESALMYALGENESGISISVFGPFLSRPTACRLVATSVYYYRTYADISDVAFTHNQSTSYDGFTLFQSGSNFTGLVSVYGLVGA